MRTLLLIALFSTLAVAQGVPFERSEMRDWGPGQFVSGHSGGGILLEPRSGRCSGYRPGRLYLAGRWTRQLRSGAASADRNDRHLALARTVDSGRRESRRERRSGRPSAYLGHLQC
jgi:hypothetical protein